MDNHYVFAFGEKLPWETHVVMMILGEAPGGTASGSGETSLRKTVVNNFTTSIINLWNRAFGVEYIQPRKVVQDKVRRLLQSYYNDVTKAATSKKEKLMIQGRANVSFSPVGKRSIRSCSAY